MALMIWCVTGLNLGCLTGGNVCAWMVLTPAGGRYGVVFLRGLYIAVLGPVLFLIFINDIDNGLSSNVLKFADDTKVFSVIDSYIDGCGLQADLRNIEK